MHKRRPHRDLPPYVVLKGEKGAPLEEKDWHVRLNWPTKNRNAKGHIIYDQVSRLCEPKTAERAAELAEFLQNEFKKVGVDEEKNIAGQTVEDFLRGFLKAKEPTIEPATREFYWKLFNICQKHKNLCETSIADLGPKKLQAMYQDLRDLDVSLGNLKRVHKLLKMAFKQAVVWGDLAKNPCDGVIVPRVKREEVISFDADEAKNFIANCTDKDLDFELALQTGMRPQEVLALTWPKLNASKCIIRIDQATEESDSGAIRIKTTKTESSKRNARITANLRDKLLAHKAAQQKAIADMILESRRPLLLEHKRAKGSNYERRKHRRHLLEWRLANFKQNDLIFPNQDGNPSSRKNINRKRFKPLVEKIGLVPAKYSFKTLRHTFATLLLREGASIKLVSELLGHASPEITLITYTHVLPDDKSNAHEMLSAILYEKKEGA